MGIKKSVKEYFAISAAKINSVLIIPSTKLTADDIHRLRVHIKKIRALLSLSKTDAEKRSSKSLKVVKSLFASAGALRELQLRAQAVQKKNVGNKLSDYLYYLDLCILYEKKNLKKELRLISDTETLFSSLKQQLKHVGKKQIKAFEKDSHDRKQEILKKKKISSEELHELRKQLKKKVYLHEALGDLIAVDPNDKKTSKMLGEWHDYFVMAAHIKKDLEIAKLPANEIKLLKKMASEYLTRGKSLQSLLINKRFNPSLTI